MLDKTLLPYLHRPLAYIARLLQRCRLTANIVTLGGFVIGLAAMLALSQQYYLTGLALMLTSRLCDGLDGMLARLSQPTQRGAFLDITLDFIFYSAIPFGFALADPARNALPAAALIFSFIGTGTSFLAFAIMAAQRGIQSAVYPSKGFYYLGGLTEASETLLCFSLMCLFPAYFPWLAWGFAALCGLTTITRLAAGWATFDDSQQP